MRKSAIGILFIAQAILIVLFGVFVDYDEHTGPEPSNTTEHQEKSQLDRLYPMFQDVHVMMLIGFGFLMTFLKKHGFNSVAFNFLLTCFVIEWSLLVNGWFGMITKGGNSIPVNIESLLHADFAVAAVLISFGAVLGVTNPLQLIVMAVVEVVSYNLNIFIGVEVLGAVDVGGSIFIHAFGAYFGLAVARMLYKKEQDSHENEGSNTHSDLLAMIGTLFLWLYWPSFNAGPAYGNERHRAVVNTILSLSACTVVTFAVSAAVGKRKLNMVHIQNATLAGGVAMGASADLIVQPFGALLIGSSAGVVSTLGYEFLQPLLLKKAKLHDTCGVNNLHGMPGILGAIVSAITIAAASKEVYKASYDNLFVPDEVPAVRVSMSQAAAQVAALLVALLIALVCGALTGIILKQPIFNKMKSQNYFDDTSFWIIETDSDAFASNGREETRELKDRDSDDEQKIQTAY